MESQDSAHKGMLVLKVLKVKHWTDKTFSFSLERPKSFRFRSGEFVMIGLENGNKPLMRAYSIASPSWSDKLEFYSIKVQDGPLTSKLQNLKIGDNVLIRPKPVGTLVLDALIPASRLLLFSTGTGIAPFASVIRDPETYLRFDKVILTHTCRYRAELEFGKSLNVQIKSDELLQEFIGSKLSLISTTTRDSSKLTGRLTDWLNDNRFAEYTGDALNVGLDRVMICGSMDMLQDHKGICESLGMNEGSNSEPGHFVIEKAFVD